MKQEFKFPENISAVEKSALRRIFRRSRIEDGGCWMYGGAKNSNGYGVLSVCNSDMLVHRISFEAFKHPIGNGLFVCHRCDTPGCFNPEHLFQGTQSENIQDCVNKGRHARVAGIPKGTIIQNTGRVRLNLLMHLSSRPKTASEVSVALSCSKSNTTGLISRLRRDGLVQVSRNPKDARIKILSITESGLVRIGEHMTK